MFFRFSKKKKEKKDNSRFTKLSVHYTMEWDGLTRDYYVYAPTRRDNTELVPLYVGLHGLTGTGATQIRSMAALACELCGGILVCPQGLEDMGMTGWNAGVQHAISGKAVDLHGDYNDVGFINAMIDNLLSKYPIDKDRIFVIGFSMGGFMANRLAVEYGDRFRAVCSINGTLGKLFWDAKPKCPVNFLHIHGTADTAVEYAPDFSPHRHHPPHGIGAEQLVEYWRSNNHCDTEPTVFDFPHVTDNNITFQMREYLGGTNGAKTAFIKVTNGEHTLYDQSQYDISCTIEIMHFFNTAPLLKKQ